MKTPFTALLLAVASIAAALAPTANASTGYELSASKPSRALPGPERGLAVDQVSHDIYVAITTTNPTAGTFGEVDRFNSDLTADGVFAKEGGFYTGVAVNPLTQGFYAAQIKIDIPLGSFGTQRMDLFSSAGASTGSFALLDAESLPPIATDSAGRVFYPYTDGGAIQVFNSAGALQQTITCSGCPGGAFGEPVSVATDAADNLYVADVSPDRVIKLSPSGGSYVFASIIQSGRGATSVGVDPSTGDVLVGDLMSGRRYHIVAYDSSGVQFDDFGVDIFGEMPSERTAQLTPQMAVDGTTHRLYVGSDESFFAFERVTIPPPSATIKAAAAGQVTATLNATVNANGHAVLHCEFELTDAADVGFASATSLPCPENPDGSSAKALKGNATGLSPESSYRYRVTATSNAGSVTSGSEVFQTLPELPPVVTAEPPQGVTETVATMQGKVNPRGGTVSNCHFELGTTASYGTNLSCAGSIPPVPSDLVVSKKASALIAGTTYHYRLVVTTNAGTTQGADVKFTTKSPPTEPKPEKPAPSPAPSIPPATTPPPPDESPITAPHRPTPCRKGFHRRKVRGKVRCVKKVKRRHKHRAHR
jgi:hypothetical protein